MANLEEIVAHLDTILDTYAYQDASLNGLQVESAKALKLDNIDKIALAVDSGQSIIESAIAKKCQILIVHHGLFWGESSRITGSLAKKIETLMQGGCALYCSHLPLDGNETHGNAYELARALSLEELEPFCHLDGKTIGVQGKLAKPIPTEQCKEELAKALELSTENQSYYPLLLPFGKNKVQSIGIATGSATFAASVSKQSGHDLFITGEPKQEAYHLAKELETNLLFGGHYATETFGVKSLGKMLEEEFNVKTFFLDEPTGI